MNDKVKELLAKQSYKGTPVITLRQLTEALSVGKSTVRSSICVNRDKFVEGVDCFRLNGQELLSVKREGVIPVNPAAAVVMLLSQKGVNTYLSLRKMPEATQIKQKSVAKESRETPANLVTVQGTHCYIDANQVAWLNVEDVARGLGFVMVRKERVTTSGDSYEAVRWDRVNGYLREFGFISTSGDSVKAGDYIPENMFYRLAMKANNEIAQVFQAKVADEILPTLRRTSHQGKALPGKQQKVQQSLVTTKTIWSQEPVLTTEQLANFYKTTTDNIKVNFNRNQDRFVEGKHYFKLEGQNLVTFKNCVTNSYLVQNNTSTLYLWTKRGAARHAKMLHTDKAWEVFEQLEDTYFAVQEGVVTQQVQPTMNREEFKQTIAKINQAEEQRVTAIQKVATLRKQLAIAENDLSSLETSIETLYKTVNVTNTPSDINKVIEAAQTVQPLLQDDSYTIGDLHKLVENKMSVKELHDYAKTKGELTDTFNRNRAKLSEEDAAIIMATLGVKLENVSQALLQQTMSFQQVTEKLAALGYTQLQGQNLSASNLLSLLKEQNLPLEEQPHKKGFLIKNNTVTKQTFLDLLSFLGKPS